MILTPTRRACFGFGSCLGAPASALVLPSPSAPHLPSLQVVAASCCCQFQDCLTPVTNSSACTPCLKSTVAFLCLVGLRLMERLSVFSTPSIARAVVPASDAGLGCDFSMNKHAALGCRQGWPTALCRKHSGGTGPGIVILMLISSL